MVKTVLLKDHKGNVYGPIKVIETVKCQSCGKNEGTNDLHSCPYNSDINNNDTPCCNCCKECCHQCAMDI